MDFKRIQVLLIICFVIFDIYLAYILINRAESLTPSNVSPEIALEVRLSERGITYGEIEETSHRQPYIVSNHSNVLAQNLSRLTNQRTSLNDADILVSEFDEPIDLNLGLTNESTGLDDRQREIIQNLLKQEDVFIQGEEYLNYWYVNSERAIYVRMLAYDGQPIVDGTAQIRLALDDSFRIIGYNQTHQSQITPLSEKQSLISQKDALDIVDGRSQSLIPDNSVVHYFIPVYYRSHELEDFSLYSPAWQIIYDNSEGRFTLTIDAVKGTVVSQESIT